MITPYLSLNEYKTDVTDIGTTMDNLIQNRTRPGLKEYESRIYAALIGIGEGNARQIHEASGVPRPRVYDIAEGLAKKGFVSVRRGTPLLYVPVEPAVVVHQLKSGTEHAAVDAIREPGVAFAGCQDKTLADLERSG
jgi:sugar-specific transcriptional regulator TrmB